MSAYEKFRLNIYNQLNYGDINENIIIDDIDSNDTAIFEKIKESIRRRKGISRIKHDSNTQKKKDINRIKHDRKSITLIDGITSNNKLDEVIAREDHVDMLHNAVVIANNVDDFVASDDHELNTEETFQGHIINCDNDTFIDLIENDNNKDIDNHTSDPGFVGKAEKVPRKNTKTILKRKIGRPIIDPSLKVNVVPAKNKVDDVSLSVDQADQAAPKKKRGFQKGHKINFKGKITAYNDLET